MPIPKSSKFPARVWAIASSLLIGPAAAASFQQTVNSTNTSSAWDDAIWGSPAAVAASGNTYLTATGLMTVDNTVNLGTTEVTGRVRAYAGANGNPVFGGDLLTITAGSELLIKDGSTAYNANLVLNGGILRFSPNSGVNATLSGSIQVTADSVMGSVQSSACTFRIGSVLTGNRTLRLAAGTGANQTIAFDDGVGSSLNGFSGTLAIGGGGTRVTVDFTQPYNLSQANITMGTFATADVLALNANLSVRTFTFGASTLASGTYGVAMLNSSFGNGSQFTGSGTLTVLGINLDSDSDGLPDSFEDRIIHASALDMVDGYEDVAGPNNAPQVTDFDGDGLSDAAEHANGVDPTSPDSDKDGYGDAVELAAGTNPASEVSMPPGNPGNPRSLPLLAASSGAGGFTLLAAGAAVPLVYDASDATVVGKAASLYADDVEAVGGVRPLVTQSISGISGPVILVGTLGGSPLIDALVTAGKLDVSGIRGNWECYRLARVINPIPGIPEALVVAGSDRRGTAYGLGAISEAMGVSPWTWWADVPPSNRPDIHLAGLPLDSNPPSVRFRGIFINDEDWGLQEWAEKTFEAGPGEVKDIGPKTYAKIFELLLRLRANYCWPGMHPSTRAFNYYTANKQVADDYAVVMGSSHAEPMLRNNVDEWYRFTADNGYSNNWNYSQNKPVIYEYWDTRAQETAPFESTYVIGKRGIHDSGMVEGANNTEKAAWLNTIFADQRQILASRVNPDPARVPQIFVPYKEVLSIYDTGLVNVPDDVTLVWPDDNHGYIRRLSSSTEQLRAGGGGVYYHLSYWGDPQDYLWLSTIPPSLIWEEMSKAYENRCRRLWVFNVGDIKPSEISMEFALRLAWNVNSYGPDSQIAWLKEWAAREFGENASGAVASVMNDYFRLNHTRKPEHMNWCDTDSGSSAPPIGNLYSLFSQVHEGDEMETRIQEFALLRQRANKLLDAMPVEKRDALYQLVAYPVRGSEDMNLKFLHTAKAQRAISQKRKTAAFHSGEATSAYNRIIAETSYFNTTLANGKWNEMMDWRPRGLAVFNMPSQPADPGPQSLGLGVAVEGRLSPVFTGATGGTSSVIDRHAVDDATSLVAPMQETTLDGLRCTWTPGSGGVASAGSGGRATYSFQIPATGSYSFKFLVRTPNANDDSWHIQIDGGTPVVWNDVGINNPVGWRWVTWSTVALTAGTHSLTVHQREDGAAMAAIKVSDVAATGELGEDERFADFRLPEFNSITRRRFFIDLINTESGPLAWSATTDDPWVKLSSTSGSLSSEQRLTASIDWANLPGGENPTSAIRVHQGSNTISIPVTVWNPGLTMTTDFIEENGAVVMEAEHASAFHAGTDASWIPLPNLGRGDGSMIVKPASAPSRTTPAQIVANAPSLEYSFYLRTPGTHQVEAVFLPALSLNNDRGRRYAVSVDGATPTIVSLSAESGSGSTWSRSVVRSTIKGSSTHTFGSSGNHTLKIWMVDPGLVLDRIGVHTMPTPYTYHGLRESAVDPLDTLYVAAGETFLLDGSDKSFKRIVNDGTLEIRSSALAVYGDLINQGTLRVMGDSTLTVGGNVSNFGVLDSMSWQSGGPSGLSDYSDFGSILDTGYFHLEDHWMAEGQFHMRLPGFEGHRYALQKNDSLSANGWESAGSPQYGSGTYGSPVPLTFSWPAVGPRMFFRVELDGAD